MADGIQQVVDGTQQPADVQLRVVDDRLSVDDGVLLEPCELRYLVDDKFQVVGDK